MKTIRLLLSASLLALAASAASAQSGKGDARKIEAAPETESDRAKRARNDQERAHAERFPMAPKPKPAAPSDKK